MESPDVPWAKSHDTRIKKKYATPPGSAAIFFYDFLKSTGIKGGRIVDLGCGTGRAAIFFADNGFEVHAVDKSDEVLQDLDLHGVMPHCHSVTDYWLFEDSFFDFALDIFCYCQEPDEEKKGFYRSELRRVLKTGGYYLLAVPEGLDRGKLATDFPDFDIVASKELEDVIDGKKVNVSAFIMKAK